MSFKIALWEQREKSWEILSLIFVYIQEKRNIGVVVIPWNPWVLPAVFGIHISLQNSKQLKTIRQVLRCFRYSRPHKVDLAVSLLVGITFTEYFPEMVWIVDAFTVN